jgi:class 3 adenylate cyclase
MALYELRTYYSKLAGADEERTLARSRALRSDLIDPTIAVHHGRVVKRNGDGILIEFRSVVDAVRCAIEVQNGMVECNAGLPPERRIELRVGIHLGDVVEESDGDLMGDDVNIAWRLAGVADPGGTGVPLGDQLLDAEITSPNSLQVVPSNFINCICLIGAKSSALVDTVTPGSSIGSFKS